jgi:hypothetical protein
VETLVVRTLESHSGAFSGLTHLQETNSHIEQEADAHGRARKIKKDFWIPELGKEEQGFSRKSF